MSLRNRMKKLESSCLYQEPYVLIWSGIRSSRLPDNCVYCAEDYELITSSVEDAARSLVKRLRPIRKPALLLVNR